MRGDDGIEWGSTSDLIASEAITLPLRGEMDCFACVRNDESVREEKRPAGVTPPAFSCNCRLGSGSAAIP
jgi:hypothetical protein